MSAPWGRWAVDGGVVVALGGLALASLLPVYAGPGALVAAVGGLLVGVLVALAGARWRWGALPVAAVTVVAYLLVGGPLALRSDLLAGAVPSLVTLDGLLVGVVGTWKDLLTAPLPVVDRPELLVAPLVLALLGGVGAGTCALRARRPAWTLLPVAVVLAASVALGADAPRWAAVQGGLLLVVAVGWLTWRARRAELGPVPATGDTTRATPDPVARRARTRRLVGAAAMLVLAGVLAGVAGAGLGAAQQRQVLRDHVVPPLDLREYPSPLVGYRAYLKDHRDDTVLRVSGLPAGQRLRVASLDLFDGQVYDVGDEGGPGSDSGAFTPVGEEVPDRSSQDRFAAPGDPTTADLQVDVGDYAGVWLPTLGRASTVRFDGPRAAQLAAGLHYDQATGAALTTAGLAAGDGYRVTTRLPAGRTDEQIGTAAAADVVLPDPVAVPDVVARLAAEWTAGSATPLQRARDLELRLHRDGFFSDGLPGEVRSRAGHGAERIQTLLDGEQMIGDDEQYAVAMALMARSVGLPARVVLGFAPRDGAPGAPVAVTGDDVTAWVEVPFAGAGWVAFDPTPPEDQVPQEQAPRPKTTPKPQVLQPPPPPQQPVEAPPASTPGAQQDDPADDGSWAWLLAALLQVLAWVGVPLVVLALPLALVVLLKARRRRRRARTGTTVDRVSAGWREVLDVARDMGVAVAPGATRREGAAVLADRFGHAHPESLAGHADAGVFAPGEPSEGQVGGFWAEVDRTTAAMAAGLDRRHRWLARVSPRSLLPGATAALRRLPARLTARPGGLPTVPALRRRTS